MKTFSENHFIVFILFNIKYENPAIYLKYFNYFENLISNIILHRYFKSIKYN